MTIALLISINIRHLYYKPGCYDVTSVYHLIDSVIQIARHRPDSSQIACKPNPNMIPQSSAVYKTKGHSAQIASPSPQRESKRNRLLHYTYPRFSPARLHEGRAVQATVSMRDGTGFHCCGHLHNAAVVQPRALQTARSHDHTRTNPTRKTITKGNHLRSEQGR